MDDNDIEAIENGFEAHLASLDHDGQTPFTDRGRTGPSVPSNTFWLVDGRDFIGSVNIRSRVDTHSLAHFGGHVGYAVRSSMRCNGYGTLMLALALQVCRGMGISIVRISCAETNIGSRRVIENNGGVMLRRCEPAWYADDPYLLFEIILI